MPLLEDENPKPQRVPAAERSGLRGILPYTTVLTILVALYVAWTLWSRHAAEVDSAREAQEKAAAAEQERAADITQHGQLAFTTFYAADAVLSRGKSTRLCYGVLNATSVKLDPPVEPVHPTERHCLDISPAKTTTYTLTATDGAGKSKSLSLTVKVR
jgi:hypothetical protein